MLEELKEKVCKANLKLYNSGIVISTFGNVSQIDRDKGLVVIKPSGVKYSLMGPNEMIVVDLDGNVIEGNLRPSTDTSTHLELYKAYNEILGIAHTHSVNATAFAQAGVAIKPFGTTHADHFYGEIPVTRELTQVEVENNYELNTGKVIIETVKEPLKIPGVLVKNHGVFAFGTSAINSVDNAIILENVAQIAIKTLFINNNTSTIPDYLLQKHHKRKFGKDKYYGQTSVK